MKFSNFDRGIQPEKAVRIFFDNNAKHRQILFNFVALKGHVTDRGEAVRTQQVLFQRELKQPRKYTRQSLS